MLLRLILQYNYLLYGQIIVRDTKGNESRVTMLPESIAEELKIYL